MTRIKKQAKVGPALPMTNATSAFISSQIAAGQTDDAAIVAAHAALPSVTVTSIPLSTLEAYLNARGLLEQIKLVTENAATPQDVSVGLKSFINHLSSPRQANLDTTDPTIAAVTQQVLGGLVAIKLVTADQVGAIYTLGGGLAYSASLTVDEVAAVRAETAAVVASRDREKKIIAAYNAAMALSQSGETGLAKIQAAFDASMLGGV